MGRGVFSRRLHRFFEMGIYPRIFANVHEWGASASILCGEQRGIWERGNLEMPSLIYG